ncbi:MAG: hypothetical protein JWS12_568 [Candidatus Saccharibacteria bacterium]|nr:hypothetical protein [Candidatus Saccharibacteria bacterium]
MVIKLLLLIMAAASLALVVVSWKRKVAIGRRYHYFRALPMTAAAAVVLVIAATLAWSNTHADGQTVTTTTTTSSTTVGLPTNGSIPKGGVTIKVSDEVIKKITVRTASFDCPTLVTSHGGSTMASLNETVVVPSVNVYKDVSTSRKASDNLDTPLPGKTPTQQRDYLRARICENALLGGSWANMLAGLNFDGISVLKQNPWLRQFADVSKVNDRAEYYFPFINIKSPEKTLTDAQKVLAVRRNIAWQQEAELIGTLIGQFQIVGDQAPTSVRNWHLAMHGSEVKAHAFPEVGLNPLQENRPALVIRLIDKGACAPWLAIGANLEDKRPEVFMEAPKLVCQRPKPKPRPGTPGSTSPHRPPTHGTTTTTRPGTTTTTQPTTSTTVVCSSGKCQPPNTVAPPPITAAPSTTTTTSHGAGQGGSGTGESTNTTTPSPTSVPSGTTPTSTATGGDTGAPPP